MSCGDLPNHDRPRTRGGGRPPSCRPSRTGERIEQPDELQDATYRGLEGDTIAALNLYGRDAAAMAPLIAGVPAIFDPDLPLPADRNDLQPLNAGGEELLTGFAEALATRSTIQLALGIIMGHTATAARDAYIALRLRAADAGISLLTAAESVIAER